MSVAHSKISRPTLPSIIQRERLFSRLDEALASQLTWISAPAGAGKTTLLSSYLENRLRLSIWYRIDERDRDIPTFLTFLWMAANGSPTQGSSSPIKPSLAPYDGTSEPRSWLEQYYAALPYGTIIVFEDYDEVSESHLFEAIFFQAIQAIPAGISVVVTSRQSTPSSFSRFRARRQLSEITWKDLQLRLEETEEILALHGRVWPAEAVAAIQKEVDGWPAGVMLLSLHDIPEGTNFCSPTRSGDRKILFDYFASEVFAHFSREDRAFMLKTAFLPTMTAELAQHLSGEGDSPRILARLHARGYFIERCNLQEDTYRYHPLFRTFLLQTALNNLLPREISTLQHEAARRLEEKGAVDDAVEILRINSNWEFLIGIVQRNASRYIGSGRVEAVRLWLGGIPQTVAEGMPACHYWQGCCSMTDSPADALVYFTKAFELAEMHDLETTLLAWSGVVKAIIMGQDNFTTLDSWIAWMDNYLLTQAGVLPPALEGLISTSMTWALTCRQPHHPELNNWLNRMRPSTRRGDRQSYLEAQMVAANYYCWTGDMPELEIALKELRELVSADAPSGPIALAAAWLLGIACAWQDADANGARHKAIEGLAMAEITGNHFFDHLFHAANAYGFLLNKETKPAEAAINDMIGALLSRNRLAFAQSHFLHVWRALLDGDIHAAVSNSSQAVRFAKQTGMIFVEILCRLAHARVLHETGDNDDARKELSEAATLAESGRSPLLLCMCRLLEALIALNNREMECFRECASKGFGTMHEQGYVSLLWWWIPDDMSRLCGAALEEGIETGFVMGLIRRHGLLPSLRTLRSDQWPWLVKIYTMGRFNVIVKDLPLPSSGKSQAKPLAMLQAIIAMGGRGVAQEQLIESLWPDADGDVGHQSFATTLHRLRKLIGHEQLILLQDGKVSINPLLCWVDVWAIERTVSSLLEGPPESLDTNTIIRRTERLLSLYHGPFLGKDSGQEWSISLRERLRSRLLRVIQHVGFFFENIDPAQAMLLYEKGIETDPFIEEFYQGLMRCHAQQGKKGDVHSAYQRCGSVLKGLGSTPSRKTEALYREILTAQQIKPEFSDHR